MKDADNQDNTAGKGQTSNKGAKGSAKTSGKQETEKPAGAKNGISTSQPDQNEGVDKVTPAMIESVKSLVEKYSAKGLKMEKILKMYSIKDIAEMNVVQYKDCMGKLELYKKKESEESKNE